MTDLERQRAISETLRHSSADLIGQLLSALAAKSVRIAELEAQVKAAQPKTGPIAVPMAGEAT